MRIFLTTLLLASMLTASLAQTVRRVNNNPGITGTNVYATFALAHAAAASGDIIIIDPSSTSYGNITITKPLKIYGNGYLLGTNTELKADQRYSFVELVEFNTGSDGSEIYGVTSLSGTFTIYGVSNITISRNYLLYPSVSIQNNNKATTTTTNVSNIVISKNFGASLQNSYFTAGPSGGKTISNVLITNNIIGSIYAGDITGIQNWVVRNNTFLGVSSNNYLANCILENNLFLGGGTGITLSNVTSSHNVSTSATFSSGSNNVNNYVIAPLNEFDQPVSELLGAGAGISKDEEFQIKAGSALKTLGSSSSEVGAYGGSTPYIISGIPAIPSITSFINTATGDASTPVKVTISVKSNN